MSMGFTLKMMLTTVLLTLCLISSTSALIGLNDTNYKLKEVYNGTNTNVLFQWQDYSVLAAVLLTSCMIGIYYGYFGDRQVTSGDFLLAGSSVGTFPMALSLTASFITAIELLGNPAEMYMYGVQFWMICVSFFLVVPIASLFYLPVFMTLRPTSCYEYLEMRFCKPVRLYASALYLLQMIMYTAVCVYAPALALSDVTGLNVYVAVSLVYLVCIFYGSLGGMKAVIMTDIFLSALLIASLVTITALSVAQVGGISAVWTYAWKTDRLRFFDMNPDPTVRHTFWSVVIGGTLYWLSMFCSNQASVQKYVSVQELGQVKRALWMSAIGLTTVYTVNFITGAALALYYSDCDPLQIHAITKSDRLLPLYVENQMEGLPGVPGLFVAGIFAASLGTVATALNSLAAIICQDFVNGLFGKLPEYKEALIARYVSVLCGVISFALVFVIERLGPVLQLALSFNGMAGGIILGLFTLGMFIPLANAKGAIVGGIFGLVVVIVAGTGAELSQLQIQRLPVSIDGCDIQHNLTSHLVLAPTEYHEDGVFWLFRVSYLWYTGLGCSVTLAIGILVSLFTKPLQQENISKDLISPPVLKLIELFSIRYKRDYIRLD